MVPWLAEELARSLPRNLGGKVLDPTVGGGALLTAVQKRFADRVKVLGIDVDQKTVRRLKLSEPDWVLSRADVLSPSSRRTSRAWREAKEQLAAVVVNPPFSYRGNQGAQVSFDGFHGRVAPAMHFLVELILELSPETGFYAILPNGALEAQKHEALWAEIERRFLVKRLNGFKTTSFTGARVSTSLVHLRPSSGRRRLSNASRKLPHALPETAVPVRSMTRGVGCRCVEVIRGRVPVHSVKTSPDHDELGVPFLHTTNVARPPSSDGLMAPIRLADEAPLVLIPRVGSWRPPVVVDIGRVVLSDCLFGLRPRDRNELDRLRASIEQAQTSIHRSFKGTGAKYLTLVALVGEIERLGWHPHVVRASMRAGTCGCGHEALVPERLKAGILLAE